MKSPQLSNWWSRQIRGVDVILVGLLPWVLRCSPQTTHARSNPPAMSSAAASRSSNRQINNLLSTRDMHRIIKLEHVLYVLQQPMSRTAQKSPYKLGSTHKLDLCTPSIEDHHINFVRQGVATAALSGPPKHSHPNKAHSSSTDGTALGKGRRVDQGLLS